MSLDLAVLSVPTPDPRTSTYTPGSNHQYPLVRGVSKEIPVPQPEHDQAPKLAPREREVLRLFSTGLSYAQMARRMGISCHTVDSYLRRVRVKTGMGSRAELVQLALVLEMLDQIERDELLLPVRREPLAGVPC